MSLPNCGSVVPVSVPFVNSSQSRHCEETPIPAINAKNSATPTRMRPRNRAVSCR